MRQPALFIDHLGSAKCQRPARGGGDLQPRQRIAGGRLHQARKRLARRKQMLLTPLPQTDPNRRAARLPEYRRPALALPRFYNS